MALACNLLSALSLFAVLFCPALMAQKAENISVYGRVVDTANVTIPGAIVSIKLGVKAPVITYATQSDTVTATTDAHGQFQATVTGALPLVILVSATAEGYISCGDPNSPASSVLSIVRPGSKSISIDVCVARPSRISGTIVDTNSGLPLAGAQISAMQQSFMNGSVMFWPRATAASSENGDFTLSGLPAGDYSLRVKAGPDIQFRPLASPPQSSGTGYGSIYWPAMTTDLPDEGQTFAIPAGADEPLGTIGIHRQNLRVMRVLPHGFSCSESLSLHVVLLKTRNPGQEEIAQGDASCSGFGIANVYDGDYVLVVQRPQETAQAYAVLNVSKNDSLDIFAEQIASVKGKVLLQGAPEGSAIPAPLKRLTLFTQPEETYRTTAENTSSVDAAGLFTSSVFPNHPYHIYYNSIPDGYYVKAIRVDGIAQPEIDHFTPSRQSALEIVVSDRPATFKGRVAFDSASGAHPACAFVLLRSGLSSIRRFREAVRVPVGDDGTASRSGLPPGEYDLICLKQTVLDSLNRPSLLERVIVNPLHVTLPAGQSTQVTVSLSN